jgi:hypothetical protein
MPYANIPIKKTEMKKVQWLFSLTFRVKNILKSHRTFCLFLIKIPLFFKVIYAITQPTIPKEAKRNLWKS